LKSTTLLLAFIFVECAAAGAAGYRFAGISAETKLDDIQNRYPTSSYRGDFVLISEADSHDHIYSISAGNQHVRIGFERTDSESGHDYPTCDSVTQKLIAANGKPSETREFHEESMLSLRLTWKSEYETMALHCFLSEGNFLAEAVSFYRD